MDKDGWLIALSANERLSGVRFSGDRFSEQPEVLRVFAAVWEIESQVNNGGFDQYFFNCGPAIIEYAPVALCMIGAKACAAIVERAIEVVALLPVGQAGRYRAMEDADLPMEEQLALLDAAFWAYPDGLTDLLFRYVREHPDEFGPSPVE